MSKIFETQFENGSLIDRISKTSLTPVGTQTFKQTEKGKSVLFDGGVSSSNACLQSNLKIVSVPYTLVVNFKYLKNASNSYILSQTLLNDPGRLIIDLQPTNRLEYFIGGDSVLTNPLQNNIWYQAIMIRDSDGVVTCYLNNTYIGTFTNANLPLTTNFFEVGGSTVIPNKTHFGHIQKVIVYNNNISEQERNQLYQEFLQSQPTEKPVRGFELVKPTDLSHERNTHFTGDEYTQVMEFTDNASDSSILRLNNGGDFAVVDWTSNSDFQEISTSSETESPVIPSTVKIFAKNGVLTYFYSPNNNFSFDIANLPSGLIYYINAGSNTTTGDIANLPSDLTYYSNTGSNTTTGDIANLPSKLTYYRNAGSNTTTGDIANLPSDLTYYYNAGNNQVNTYTAGRVWANNMQYFRHLPAVGYGLSSTDVDNLLIDLANVTTWTSYKDINLSGNNAAPGPLGEAAIDTLRNVKGVTVTVTGGY